MPFIYALCEPDTMAVRYVGKANVVAARMKGHRSEKRSTRKCRWLASLRYRGLAPVIRVLEEVPANAWEMAERHWIARFRSEGCDLTNHTDGGDGVRGLDAEARARVGASMKVRMSDPAFRARIFTLERAAKISAALKGKEKSRDHIAKLPQNRPGRKLTTEHRAKISANRNGHRWTSEESRRMNLGNNHGIGNQNTKGRQMPESEKIARSVAQLGRPKTSEHREKIRQAQIRSWAKRKSVKTMEYQT